MNLPKVNVKIGKLEHELMKNLFESVFLKTPVEGWQLETYIISNLFYKRMQFFLVSPFTGKKKELNFSMTMIEAIAFNAYFGATSGSYNVFLRMKIEPQLKM